MYLKCLGSYLCVCVCECVQSFIQNSSIITKNLKYYDSRKNSFSGEASYNFICTFCPFGIYV